jgi:hypothetical protein
MTRHLKTLGLALLAVAALSALGAAPAGASEFKASKYPTSFTGVSAKGNEVIKTEAGNVECKGHFSGTIASASEDIEFTPTYTECKAFGFVPATVNANGCEYRLFTNEATDLFCPAGHTINILAGTCAVTIAAQSGLQETDVSTKNEDITVQATITGLDYTVTQDGLGCAFAGVGVRTNGAMTQGAEVTVQGSGASIHIT